ncbi:unnamed protein product [Bemisia tabaci]|uniref:Uncharacterized protein n=2 Tax=Bemisia tabaci TaxID=7038 RepID=A0A9P0F8U7_BEMTA|nr:unnamed protein product [Bemisia tabaci]
MSVTESNIDDLVQLVGNPKPELTTGGKKRLVKTIMSLHRRQSVLVKCLKAVKTGEPLVVDRALAEVRTIIATPLLRVSERSPHLTGLIFTIFILAKEKMDIMPPLSQRVLMEGNFSAIAIDIQSNPSFNLDQRLVARNYLPSGNKAGKPSPVSELITVGTPIEQKQQQQTSSLHDRSADLRRQDEEFLKGLPDLLKGFVRAKL